MAGAGYCECELCRCCLAMLVLPGVTEEVRQLGGDEVHPCPDGGLL